MSLTTSVEVVGPSHWTYMAAIMADSLAAMAKRKKIKVAEVPQGIYSDALRFFSLVTQAADNAVPQNPPASINAYAIAASLVSKGADGAHTRAEIGQRLKEYSTLVKRLAKPGHLRREEIHTANRLQKFFVSLRNEGEAEAYDTSGHFQVSQNPGRLD